MRIMKNCLKRWAPWKGVRKVSLYEMESLTVEGELLSCYVSDDFGKLELVEVYEGIFSNTITRS